MHKSSYDKVEKFKNDFLDKKNQIVIYDIGSQDVNGCYKPIFESTNWIYKGIDMCPGNNVDIVVKNSLSWHELPSNSADVIISGQALEHVDNIFAIMLEIERILKPEGLLCIVVPSSGYEHKYPIDCWRFYPDGLLFLAKFASLKVLDVYTQWENMGYEDGSDVWKDSVLVATKIKRSFVKNIFHSVKRKLKHLCLINY